MTNTSPLSESDKYHYILQLSREQGQALLNNDFATFQKILATKGAIIASLRDGRAVLAKDPGLMTVVQEIKASEKHAEKLLNSRLAIVKQKMMDLQTFKTARRAYRRVSRKLPRFVPSSETPMMFDRLS